MYIRKIHVEPHWDHTLLLDSSFVDTLVHVLCACTIHSTCTLVGGVCGYIFAANAAVSSHCTAALVYRGLKKTNSRLRESPML